MADPRFFKKSQSFTLGELAQELKCTLSDPTAENTLIDDVAPLNSATQNQLSFLDNVKYKKDFTQTKAGACFTLPEMAGFAPEGVVCLISSNPYKSYAKAAQKFYPENKPEEFIHEKASIDSTAKIGQGANISANSSIGANVVIGENAWVEPGATIQEGVTIGDNCRIGANAIISHSIIGDYVRIYPGACVGQDGFGFAIDPAGHVKVPQLGRVIIEDHVQIGANTTIDRGAGPDTIIGQGTWIDNLVQIGHNVKIGRGCIIVSQVGISGSTVIEDFVALGGQVGVAGHLTIGMATRVAAQSGVMSDLEGGKEYMGSPAMLKTKYFRQIATLNRLIKTKKKD